MVRKLLGVCSAMLAIGFAGCNLLPTDTDSVDIDLTPISSISANGHAYINAKLDGNVAITDIKATITSVGDGDESKITCSPGPIPQDQEKITIKQNPSGSGEMDIVINAASDACNGEYKFTLKVTAGSFTGEKSFNFTVTGGSDNCGDIPTPELTETQVTLGSWKSSIGSSLDADEMKVYKAGEITSSTIEAKMDAYFSNNSDGQAWLWSPKAAADAKYEPKDWSVKNDTKFLEVSSVKYDNVNTQSDIDALWSDTDAKNYADLSAGDVVIIKTNEGAKRMIKVISAETTDNGTAVIVGLK